MKKNISCILILLIGSIHAWAVDPHGAHVYENNNGTLVALALIVIVLFVLYCLIVSAQQKRGKNRHVEKKQPQKKTYTSYEYYFSQEYKEKKDKEDKETRYGCIAFVVAALFFIIVAFINSR